MIKLLKDKEMVLYNNFIQKETIFVKPEETNISKRRQQAFERIAEAQKYYQRNPVRFISDFFHIELLDFQALIVQSAWTTPNVVILETRGGGKSLVGDLIIMGKGMLFNNSWTYIASGSGAQAIQTFQTLEKLANDNIDEMVGSTGYIFKNEVVVPNANSDGFGHSSDGWRYSLYNGSFTQTLNSNVDRKRGFRGSILFDETGWLSAEMLQTYGAFAVTNKAFKTGKDSSGKVMGKEQLMSLPESPPYQKFYLSSASTTDTEFYRIYREAAIRMIMGDTDYFVANLDCSVAFEPTLKGEKIAPLLDRKVVELAMKTNAEKARREYYCEFTSDAGDNAIIRRGTITKNCEIRKPLLHNDTGDKRFVLCYDPARLSDNSVVLVGELYDDGSKGTRCKLVNCVNMVDVHKRNRTPQTIPNQIEILRQLILDYNEGGDEYYSNIEQIYIDAGAGGQASAIADLLMENWIDKNGVEHKGFVDLEFAGPDVRNFPEAVKNKLQMVSPSRYKAEMYDHMIQMVEDGNIKFTADYDNKGYIMIMDEDAGLYKSEKKKIIDKFKKEGVPEEEWDALVQQKMLEIQNVKMRTVNLSKEEESALINIDLVKDQVVNMVRIKRDSGRDGFELCPEKAHIMHKLLCNKRISL